MRKGMALVVGPAALWLLLFPHASAASHWGLAASQPLSCTVFLSTEVSWEAAPAALPEWFPWHSLEASVSLEVSSGVGGVKLHHHKLYTSPDDIEYFHMAKLTFYCKLQDDSRFCTNRWITWQKSIKFQNVNFKISVFPLFSTFLNVVLFKFILSHLYHFDCVIYYSYNLFWSSLSRE